MPTLYIDAVANRFPKAGQDDQRHCVRYAATLANHNPGVATGTLMREEYLIRPDDWQIADEVQPYLRATPADFAEDGVSVRFAFEALVPLLHRAKEIVAFNAPFHKRTIEALCRDNGCALSDFTSAKWICMMDCAAPLVQIKLVSAGRWKAPKLSEAFTHFTGLPWGDFQEWDTFASQQVRAVKVIHEATMKAKVSA